MKFSVYINVFTQENDKINLTHLIQTLKEALKEGGKTKHYFYMQSKKTLICYEGALLKIRNYPIFCFLFNE